MIKIWLAIALAALVAASVEFLRDDTKRVIPLIVASGVAIFDAALTWKRRNAQRT
jgi:hypothetical protein